MPLGFAIGILLGGWFGTVTVGWRPGFYLCAAMTMILFAVNYLGLPHENRREGIRWGKLKADIDWMGVIISSTSMGVLSYSLV